MSTCALAPSDRPDSLLFSPSILMGYTALFERILVPMLARVPYLECDSRVGYHPPSF